MTALRATLLVLTFSILLAGSAHAALVPAVGSPLHVGVLPWDANAADVNGDGDADLLVTNEGDDTVSVLLGDGDGGFAPEAGSPVAVGDNPIATAVADFNGDGRQDVAVTNYLSERLTILYRNGDNSGFTAQAAGPVAVDWLRYDVEAADVVGDARIDLVVSNLGASTVSVLEQQPDGSFAEADGSPFAAGALPAGVALGDFDGDGDQDIAAASNSDDVVTILVSGPTGFAPEDGSPIAVGDAPTHVEASDLTGDGRDDLAIANSGDDDVTILVRNAANDGFDEAPGSPAAAGDKPYDVAAANLDGDAALELVVSNETDGTLTVLQGTPAAGYTATPDSPLTVGPGPLGLVVGDFDENGRPDVAVADHANDTVSVRLNDPVTPGPPPPGLGCTPPTGGRVALWRAEGSAGDSVGTHDGLMHGGAGFAPGAVGTAFDLGGNTDRVAFPAAGDLDITGDVTLDAWVRIDDSNFNMPDPYGIGGDRLIVHKIDASDRHSTYALFIEGDGTTALAAPLAYFAGDRQLGGGAVQSFPVAWTPGTWYHVAAVRDGDAVSFYRDGAPIGTGTLGQAAASTPLTGVTLGGIQIDTDPNLFNPLRGGIDEAAIWNRALGAAEIAAIDASGRGDCVVPPPPPPPDPPAPPPPPLEKPRNLTRPAIVPARECSTQLGGGGSCSTVIPNRYRCDPGTWAGRDVTRPYRFSWERMTRDSAFFDGYRPTPVATGEIFRASSATALGLDPSRWLYRCTAEAFNDAGSTIAASDRRQLDPAYEPAAGPQNPTVNLRVTGIEVTQSIQQDGCSGCIGVLPSRDQSNLSEPATVNYQGLRLAAGKYTVVRVFADHRSSGVSGALSGVTARLEVFDSSGTRLSTLSPERSPASVAAAPADGRAYVTREQRDDNAVSFQFLVPWQQTEHQALSLRAVVSPANSGLAPLKQCAGCNANSFTLQSIPFRRTEQVRVRPVRISPNGRASGATVESMFSTAQELMPGYVQYFPYPAAVLPVPANKEGAVAAVAQWAADSRLATTDMPIGIFRREVDAAYKSLNGLSGMQYDLNLVVEGQLAFGIRSAAIAGDDRPITSVAHELGHMLGLPHADNACSTGDQMGTPNPASNVRGEILGLGLDRRASSALPRVFSGSAQYDLMSYCGDIKDMTAPDNWIGTSNWNTLLDRNAPAQALPRGVSRAGARAAAVQRPLRVTATVNEAGAASIFSVTPGRDAGVAPNDASPYRFELRDAAGGVVASVGPAVASVDGEKGTTGGQLLTATIDFVPTARELVLRRGNEVLARRARSASAPTASIVAPRGGSTIGGGTAKTTVRWRASDADRDRLLTTIDYSRDGGRTWAVVATDVAGTTARFDSRALGASDNARLRVRVSDGFDAALAMSGRLRSRGAPPLVRIEAAPRSARSDQLVLLQGSAFDDADKPLTGRRLRWFAGQRPLATGARVSVQGLPAGTRQLRLVATDARGRSATAARQIRVAAVKPQFLLFDAPATVRRTARSVRMRVASALPATLRIGGRRFAVGRTPRTVTVRIARGSKALALPVTLTASGKVTRLTYRARRV